MTEALWQVEEGDTIGFRGPYGNSYPMEQWEGKNLIFIGGGIAMPPIRCAIWYALENRDKYGDITIVYGARTVGDLVFADELDEWAEHERVRVVRCVDPGGETPDWKGEIGFVPDRASSRRNIPAENAVALVIGPPIMIKFTLPVLDQDGPGRPRHLHQPRKPHEVRRRQVRPLQLRPGLRLQGRPGLHARAAQAAAERLLSCFTAEAQRRQRKATK